MSVSFAWMANVFELRADWRVEETDLAIAIMVDSTHRWWRCDQTVLLSQHLEGPIMTLIRKPGEKRHAMAEIARTMRPLGDTAARFGEGYLAHLISLAASEAEKTARQTEEDPADLD